MTRRQTLGLIALSLLASAAWFVDDLLPVEGSPVASESLRLLLCSVVTSGVLAVRRAEQIRGAAWSYLQAVTVSFGVVALPFLLLNTARGRIASTDGVLIFALMPVATMLLASWLGREQNGLESLLPVLLGVAGVMILLPVRLPANGDGVFGVCLMAGAMLLSATSMILLHRLLRDLSLHVAIPSICLTNAFVLAAAAGVVGFGQWNIGMLWPHSLRAILFDLPQIALLIWLLKTIPPQRLAGRYLIAPLFTVVEGLFFIRPHLDVRSVAGLVLLTAGAVPAIFGRQRAEAVGLRLKLP